MEAISAIASLFQLVEGALEIAKTSKQLYKAYRGADEDVRSVHAQSKLLGRIVAEVHVLQAVVPSGDGFEYVPRHTQQLLTSAVEETNLALCQLHSSLGHTTTHLRMKDRLKWAAIERSSVEAAQKRLEMVKSTLMIVLQVVNLRLSALSLASLSCIEDAQRTLQAQLSNGQAIKPGEHQALELAAMKDYQPSEHLKDVSEPVSGSVCERIWESQYPVSRRYLVWNSYEPSAQDGVRSRCRFSDCWGMAAVAWDENQSTYSWYAQVKLPWWLSGRALITKLKVRQYVLGWPNITILSASINFCGYQPTEAPIVRACFRGDEATVRSLLQRRIASPNDRFVASRDHEGRYKHMWAGNETSLLAAAIVSGNISLVTYLITVGADVNITDGCGFSPLQLALAHLSIRVARVLVRYGADLDHCDHWKRNVPVSMFWSSETPQWDDSQRRAAHQIIQMLLSHGTIKDPLLVNREMNIGMSLLSRAIFDGDCSADTIELLLSNNGPLTFGQGYERPIFMATLRKRFDLLSVLDRCATPRNRCGSSPSMKGQDSTLQDLTGVSGEAQRTIHLTNGLQTAVRYGTLRCTRILIEAGADVDADYLTDNQKPQVEEEKSQARSCTPAHITMFQALLYGLTRRLREEVRMPMIASKITEEISSEYIGILSELLIRGLDPRQTLCAEWTLSGCDAAKTDPVRPEELLRDWPMCSASYCSTIQGFFPEVIIRDGDIYWDAVRTG